MITALRQTVKPSECGIAFGLPLCIDEFREGLQPGAPGDWARHFSNWYGNPLPETLWADYYVPEVVEPSLHILRIAEKMGVTVYRSCNLTELTNAARKHAALTLVSHWLDDGAIELSDGMHSANEVAEEWPAQSNNVLDLMICQSIKLADAIKKRCPACICVCNTKPVRLRQKLFMYGEVLLNLQAHNASYWEAVLAVYRHHLKKSA